MKIYLNAYTGNPSTKYLKDIWDFINERMTTADFETFVYGKSEEFKDLFSEETVLYLLEFPYSSGDLSDLKHELKAAILDLPTSCECIKIGEETEIDLPASEEIHYVDDIVLKTFDKIASDDTIAGHWQHVKNGIKGVKEFFQEGNYYKCRECGFLWLVVFIESNVSFIFKRIDENQINLEIKNLFCYEKV